MLHQAGLSQPWEPAQCRSCIATKPSANWELQRAPGYKCGTHGTETATMTGPGCGREDLGTSCHLHSPGASLGQLLQGFTDSNNKSIAGGHPHPHRASAQLFPQQTALPAWQCWFQSGICKGFQTQSLHFFFFKKNQAPFSTLIFGLWSTSSLHFLNKNVLVLKELSAWVGNAETWHF